jgi:gliding motility-associated lipoprotein GldH
MHRILLALAVCSMFLLSCEQGLIYSEFQPISQGIWDKDDIKVFQISETDSISSFQMFVNVRNDNSFPYSNLFLITEFEYPNGETFIDTLEYEMALPNGQWLGKGYGSIKENKLWYKENIVFPVNGVYTLRIGHAMRRNGSVDGIIELPGITDIGVEIEKLD